MTTVPSFQFPDRAKNLFVVLTILGFAVLGFGIASNPERGYHAYLIGLCYFLFLTIGGIFFAATQHVTNAGWSTTVRRIGESFFSFFWVIVAALVVLFFVHHSIYEWSHKDIVDKDALLIVKKGYLNSKAFGVRLVVIMGLWWIFGSKLRNNSLKQDQNGLIEISHKNSRLSAVFLPIFALSFSFLVFDLLMSLQPHFFSTMFAVYCFAGLFQSTLAMMIMFVYYLYDRGFLRGFVNENHFHDLGKLLFAMTVFMAYVGFSQFMLIWYANLPEETFYFLDRAVGGWMAFSYGLLIVKFIIPFLILLPREAKRNPKFLRNVAIWILGSQLWDLYWMVVPSYEKAGPHMPWMEISAFVGFLGAFVLVVTNFLSKNSIVAKNDPRLHEALNLHQ